MSSIVLAGGRSTRLGQDKVSLVFAGESLLQLTVDRLAQLGEEIILVLAQGQANPQLHSCPRVKTATDLYRGKGPLVGIYSGLVVSGDEYNLAVACDMPFLNVDLLLYMLGVAPGFEVVIPRIDGLIEPLHAVYSRGCLGPMEELIKEGNLMIAKLLEQVKVRYVDKSEIDSFDPDHLSFFNINTPADLEKAEQIMIREAAK